MKYTLIYTLDPTSFSEPNTWELYYIIKDRIRDAIETTKCTCKARLCLGKYKFLTCEDIAKTQHPLIHLVITGKKLISFQDEFENAMKELHAHPFKSKFSAQEDAFTFSNNRFIKKLSIKHTRIPGYVHPFFRLMQSS